MKDEIQPQMNEHFTPEDLASLHVSFSAVMKGEVRYTHGNFIVEFLRKLWKLDPLERAKIKINLLPVLAIMPKTKRSFWELPPIPLPHVPDHVEMPPSGRLKWYAGLTDQFIKDVKDIDRKLQGRILQAITNIVKDPTDQRGDTIKPLTSDLKGLWRYRIGDFRLVYLPNEEKSEVTLLSFASRGDVY